MPILGKHCPMDEEKSKDLELTPEEQKAEEAALKEIAEDDLRGEIAESMGIDPDAESDLLDKIVEREKRNRQMLSGAIKQKRKWRERAESKFSDKKSEESDRNKSKQGDSSEAIVEAKVAAILENRDLKDLNLPEDVESEVKDLARVKGISVREAAKLPYIQALLKEQEDKKKLDESTLRRDRKGSSSVSGFDPSKGFPNPADFDFNSPEGIKAWNAAKKAYYDFKERNS